MTTKTSAGTTVAPSAPASSRPTLDVRGRAITTFILFETVAQFATLAARLPEVIEPV
jgi:hypothetical protein